MFHRYVIGEHDTLVFVALEFALTIKGLHPINGSSTDKGVTFDSAQKVCEK